MKFGIQKRLVLTAFVATSLQCFAVLPALAENNGHSAEQLNESMQIQLQHIIEQKTARLQQVLIAESILEYEHMLAQQTTSDWDQLAVAVSIKPMPVRLEQAGELFAQAVQEVNLIDCDQ